MKKITTIKLSVLFCLVFILSIFYRGTALAVDDYNSGTILPACIETGNCSLCEIVKAFANLGDFMLGLIGSIAFLLLLYGGYVWLTSGGNKEKIQKGRNVMVSTIIGLLFFMGAWQIVNFIVSAFVSSSPTTVSFKLFTNQPWYEYCDDSLPCVNKQAGEYCGTGEFVNLYVCNDNGFCVTKCQNSFDNATCVYEGSLCAANQTMQGQAGDYCPNDAICCQNN